MRRILAALLTMVLCIGAAPAALAADQAHMELSFSELREIPFDFEAFEALGQEIADLAEEKENLEPVREKLGEFRDMYLLLDTKLEIASVDSYLDVTDEKASEAYLFWLEQYYDADRVLGDVVSQVADSPCEDALDREDAVFSAYLWGYGGYGTEDLDLYYQEEDLIDQYYMDLGQEVSVEFGGRTYTQSQADALWAQWELSDSAYEEICLKIAMAQNDALAEYYIALVENRQAQAKACGYRNGAEFYDDYAYYREFSRFQREELYDAVKREIVPVFEALEASINAAYLSSDGYYQPMSQEEFLDSLGQGLEALDPGLAEALDYMLEFGYYDMEYTDHKVDGAFTTWFSYPSAPYLMMKPTDTSYDFSTLVHEYGHYHAFFVSPDPFAYNLDLAEVHSQGLELLMLPQYDTVFGAEANLEEKNTLYAILLSLVDGCLYDELERYAYTTENLTVEDMNRKYMSLLKEYGYREESDPAEYAYGWVTNSHMFAYPMYYLSYATSASAALQLWDISRQDYQGAVETYLELVALGEGGTFLDTLEDVGLSDPLEYDTICALADELEAACGLRHRTVESKRDSLVPVLLIGVGAILIWLMVTIIVMTWAIKKERKRREEYRKYLYNRTLQSACRGGEADWDSGSAASPAGGEAWWCEGGTADALPPPGDETVSDAPGDEAPGQVCGGPGDSGEIW